MRITADAVAFCLAFIFGLILADLWLVVQQSGRATSSDQFHSADDGWRRTAHGWEQSSWSEKPIDPSPAHFVVQGNAAASHRWDFHPAWLVAIQLTCVAVAGWLFPNKSGQADGRN